MLSTIYSLILFYLFNMKSTSKFGLNSLVLKIIGLLLMTIDHAALLFLASDTIAYEVMRSIGKIAFPIFAFLAVEGVYHTHNIRNYLLRLLGIAILMDIFGLIIGSISNITIASNPLIGNVFTDLFLGVLTVYLLNRKDKFSFIAILPISLAVLSDININQTYGSIFKADWGTFSIVLFFMFFVGRKIVDFYLIKKQTIYSDLDESALGNIKFRYYKYIEAVMLIITELIFNLIWHIDNTSSFLPNEFIPIGTYSTLAFIFILLYNGKKGYNNKIVQYSFYLYYPIHLLILGIISLFFGTLSAFM